MGAYSPAWSSAYDVTVNIVSSASAVRGPTMPSRTVRGTVTTPAQTRKIRGIAKKR